jgi:carboxyl-terminal processing protease
MPPRVIAAALAVVLSSALVSLHHQTRRSELPSDLAALEEVLDRVRLSAADAPSREVLIEGAIDGALGTLGDRYADYYTEEQFDDVSSQLGGSVTGIGVVLERRDRGLVVQTVLPGSPAERAGLDPGDQIVTVNGRDVRDEPAAAVVGEVRGPAGTTVELGLEGGRDGERVVAVERAEVDLPNVESRLLEGEIGYVRLQQFTQESATRVRQVVEDLEGQGAAGYVLDLRGNPGGLLDSAVEVSAVFVEEGEEVVSVGTDAADAVARRTTEEPATDAPLVVLVDEGSASASEIVAAAVQDLGRGDVVGATSFGKGTVQTIGPLGEGGGLKFTIARYYTPSGDSIDGTGVVPDLPVASGEAGAEDLQLEAARASLAEALAAG